MIAILCSGQGGQHRDMFRLTGAAPEATPVFETAAALLDADPRRFVLEAEEGTLFGNRIGQILCCTQALAGWALLGMERGTRIVLAGYSVGELAAWGCAGYFTAAQTLKLAAERAAAMDRASSADAGMAAFTGLRREDLQSVMGGRASIAIVNGPDSFVVGGAGAALDACVADAMRSGARATRLRVQVASHTAMMEAATREFATVLRAETLQAPSAGVRLLSGIDAETVSDGSTGLQALAAQIGQTIDWASCLQACREAGATAFLELGPGSALSRMAGSGQSRSLEDFRTGQGARDWLARAA